ncbi:MAG: type II toxin-antitoxin system HipA family toxin [Bacteriovoracaceae bacterium]
MTKKTADIYLYDQLVGKLEENAEGEYTFFYLQSFLKTNPKQGISLTLPPRETPYQSEKLFSFFDGLIPEGWLLDHAVKNWKLNTKDRMGLLMSVCADPIGATHILAEGQTFQKDSNVHEALEKVSKEESSQIKGYGKCLISYRQLENEEDLYHPNEVKKMFQSATNYPMLDITLKDIENLAKIKVNQRLSVTGVQKKLSLHLDEHSESKRFTIVNFDGNFILKPPSPDYPQMPEIEHLCMKMAKLVGLPVPDCALIPLKDGQLAYLVKRFDRNGQKKFYQEDFCQLMEKQTEDKYRSSLEKASKVIKNYCSPTLPYLLQFFDLNYYSFLIGNADMHLKNFSLVQNLKNKTYMLSPCYDLLSTKILFPEDKEQTALALNAKKNKISKNDWLEFGKNMGLEQKMIENSLKKFKRYTPKLLKFIDSSFLNDKNKELLKDQIAKALIDDV